MLRLCTWTYLSSFHIVKHLFLLEREYCVTVFFFVCLFQNVLIVEVSWVLMSYCTSIKSHSHVVIVCSFSNCAFTSLAGRWWRGRGVDLLNDLSVFLQWHDGSNYIAATLIGTLPCHTQESLFLRHLICFFYGFITPILKVVLLLGGQWIKWKVSSSRILAVPSEVISSPMLQVLET